MKMETKRFVVTLINIVIFIGNSIISFINDGGEFAKVASLATGLLTGTMLA